MSYLSIAKIGFFSDLSLVEMINAILYKLKRVCQWRLLLMGLLFSGEGLNWKTVFYLFRKLSIRGEWQRIQQGIQIS